MTEGLGPDDMPNLENYDVVIQDGIFNMIITLCQNKSQVMPIEQAKVEVADWLEQIVNGLRAKQENMNIQGSN